MADKKRYKCKVVRYESFENTQTVQGDNQGKTMFAPGIIDLNKCTQKSE